MLLFCFSFTLSVILGIGFLALPVKLSKSGFAPFLVSFSVNLAIQAFILCAVTEILQRAYVGSKGKGPTFVSLPDTEESTLRDNEVGGSAAADAAVPEEEQRLDLHTLSRMYLPRYAAYAFEAVVLFHFLAILISYTIGGSSELAHVTHLPTGVVAPVFFSLLTALILFGERQIRAIITGSTLLKGSLLIVMVGVVGYLASRVKVEPKSEWKETLQPLVLGSLALGGAMNAIPVFFRQCEYSRRALAAMLGTCIAALATAWTVIVLWVYFVLHIVPQDTLEVSAGKGQLSTIPLGDIIKANYPGLAWTSSLTSSFLVVSLTVSYISVGLSTKHMLDGYVAAGVSASGITARLIGFIRSYAPRFPTRTCLQWLIYFLVFGVIAAVSFAKPSSFLTIVDTGGSVTLNLESGLFVFLIFLKSRKHAPRTRSPDGSYSPTLDGSGREVEATDVPLPLPPFAVWIALGVAVYLSAAVVYAIVLFVQKVS